MCTSIISHPTVFGMLGSTKRTISTLVAYQRNIKQVPRMEHHVLSAAVFQAGKDKVRDKELWKAYMKQVIILKPSLTLKDCRLLAQGFVEPELRWKSFNPLYDTLTHQVRFLMPESKSLRLDLCLSLNSFAKVKVTDVGLFSSVGDVIVNKKGSDLNHIDYGAILNSFSRCQRQHTRMCSFITEQEIVWGPSSLAIALTALANMKFRPNSRFLKNVSQIIKNHVPEYHAADLSGALFGLRRLLEKRLEDELVTAVEPVVMKKNYFLSHPAELAYFCASVEPDQVSDECLQMILQTSRRELSSLNASQLSMILDFLCASRRSIVLSDDYIEQISQVVQLAKWKELAIFARFGNSTSWPMVLQKALKMDTVPDANSLSWLLLQGVRDPHTTNLVSLIPKITWTQAAAERAIESLALLKCNNATAISTLQNAFTDGEIGSTKVVRAFAHLGIEVPGAIKDPLSCALLRLRSTEVSNTSEPLHWAVYKQSIGEVVNVTKSLATVVDKGSGFLRDVHAALLREALRPNILVSIGVFVAEFTFHDQSNERPIAILLETPACYFFGTQLVTPLQELKRQTLRHQFQVITLPYWSWPSDVKEQDLLIRSWRNSSKLLESTG